MSDVHQAIQGITQALQPLGGQRHHTVPHGKVVCISRDYGACGEEVARNLATRLGVPLYDHTILDKIAQRLNAEPATMKAIDAGASPVRNLWLYSLLTGQDLSADHYKHALVSTVLSLGRTGGVILGRGAHLILARSGALRVRITGSPEVCAARIATAEGIGEEQALRRVEEVNHKRAQFIWDTFQTRLNEPTTFDLVINTDQIGDSDAIVRLLLAAQPLVEPPGAAK